MLLRSPSVYFSSHTFNCASSSLSNFDSPIANLREDRFLRLHALPLQSTPLLREVVQGRVALLEPVEEIGVRLTDVGTLVLDPFVSDLKTVPVAR